MGASSTFYFSTVEPSDWTAPQTNNLWRDLTKTLFDPCPVGWRVPKGGVGNKSPWSAFTKENSVWSGQTSGFDPLAGREWQIPVLGGTTWYPTPGWRTGRGATGNSGLGGEGSTHSSTTAEIYSFRLCYTPINVINHDAGAPRTQAISIRCVRE